MKSKALLILILSFLCSSCVFNATSSANFSTSGGDEYNSSSLRQDDESKQNSIDEINSISSEYIVSSATESSSKNSDSSVSSSKVDIPLEYENCDGVHHVVDEGGVCVSGCGDVTDQLNLVIPVHLDEPGMGWYFNIIDHKASFSYNIRCYSPDYKLILCVNHSSFVKSVSIYENDNLTDDKTDDYGWVVSDYEDYGGRGVGLSYKPLNPFKVETRYTFVVEYDESLTDSVTSIGCTNVASHRYTNWEDTDDGQHRKRTCSICNCDTKESFDFYQEYVESFPLDLPAAVEKLSQYQSLENLILSKANDKVYMRIQSAYAKETDERTRWITSYECLPCGSDLVFTLLISPRTGYAIRENLIEGSSENVQFISFSGSNIKAELTIKVDGEHSPIENVCQDCHHPCCLNVSFHSLYRPKEELIIKDDFTFFVQNTSQQIFGSIKVTIKGTGLSDDATISGLVVENSNGVVRNVTKDEDTTAYIFHIAKIDEATIYTLFKFKVVGEIKISTIMIERDV